MDRDRVQTEIIALLATDPQEAMTRMVEQYTGLLWRVAEQYLENPEDIRECVNDTFLEFYLNQDRFDSSKGSLATFLAAMIRHVAISRYRKNRVRETSPLTEDPVWDAGLDPDTRLDLERALASLKPEDAEIIRMKYYGGMSVEEIARSLHLPYETVKKRHQRSLGRLRLAMIVIVVLLTALLAACTYMALRYFGIIPGYGVVQETDVSIYRLLEPVTVENDVGIYQIDQGFVVDGEVLLTGNVHFHREDPSTWRPSVAPDGAPEIAVLEAGGNPYICDLTSTLQYPQDMGIELQVKEFAIPQDPGETLELNLTWAGVDFGLAFTRIGQDPVEGFCYELGERGGLLAAAHRQEGNLMVDLYPLDTGEFPLVLPLLGDEVFLCNGNGETLAGRHEYSSYSHVSRWDFGPVEPGAYTVLVPWVPLRAPLEPASAIPLDLEHCRWENRAWPVTGGTATVTDCSRVESRTGQLIPGTDQEALEGLSYWTVTIHYERSASEEGDCQVMPYRYSPNAPVLNAGESCEIGCSLLEEAQGDYRLLVWASDGKYDLSQVTLDPPGQIHLRWECSFEIPVTVPE